MMLHVGGKTKTQLHEGGNHGSNKLAGNGAFTTYAYKASCSITLNTVSNLNIKISSSCDGNAGDESFGIDNVRITQSSFRDSTTCKNCPVGKFLNQAIPTTLCNDCPAGLVILTLTLKFNPISGSEIGVTSAGGVNYGKFLPAYTILYASF